MKYTISLESDSFDPPLPNGSRAEATLEVDYWEGDNRTRIYNFTVGSIHGEDSVLSYGIAAASYAVREHQKSLKETKEDAK